MRSPVGVLLLAAACTTAPGAEDDGEEPPPPPVPVADQLGLYAPAGDLVHLEASDRVLDYVHGTKRLAYSTRIALAGDFDGDGEDSVATYDLRSHELFIKNTNAPGPDYEVRMLGTGNVFPIAGDFDNDDIDDVGLYEISTGTFDLIGNRF